MTNGTKNEVPFESLNWFDIYVTYPGIEGEFKMTITDKGADSTEAINKSFATLNHILALAEDPDFDGLSVRAPFLVGASVPAHTQATVKSETKSASGEDYDGMFEISHIEIIPRTDGKVNANFFGKGRTYPDIYVAREPEKVAEYINNTFGDQLKEPVTAEGLSKAQKIQVAGVLYWKNSEKLNSKGNPYKNISRIEV